MRMRLPEWSDSVIGEPDRFSIYYKSDERPFTHTTTLIRYAPDLDSAFLKIFNFGRKYPLVACFIINEGKKKRGLFVRYTIFPKDQNGDYRKKCINVFKEYIYKDGRIQSYRYTTVDENGNKRKSTPKEMEGADNTLTWFGYKKNKP